MSRLRFAGLCLVAVLFMAAIPGAPAARSGRLFIANLRSSEVTVVDAATGALLRRIPLPQNPHELALSADGRFVYTALYHSNKVAAIDTSDYSVQLSEAPGLPHGVAVTGQMILVTGAASGAVWILQAGAEAVAVTIAMGDTPHAVAVDDSGRAYVANARGNSVSVVDPEARSVIGTIATGSVPEAVAVGGGLVLTANAGDNTVSIIDAATLSESARVLVEGRPVRVAVAPDGATALASSTARGSVAVIDLAARTVIRWIEVGAAPDGIAFSSDGRWAFVACGAANDIAVIDLAAGEVVGRLGAGDGPSGVLLVP